MLSILYSESVQPIWELNIIRVFVVTKSLCEYVSNQVQYNMESAQYQE